MVSLRNCRRSLVAPRAWRNLPELTPPMAANRRPPSVVTMQPTLSRTGAHGRPARTSGSFCPCTAAREHSGCYSQRWPGTVVVRKCRMAPRCRRLPHIYKARHEDGLFLRHRACLRFTSPCKARTREAESQQRERAGFGRFNGGRTVRVIDLKVERQDIAGDARTVRKGDITDRAATHRIAAASPRWCFARRAGIQPREAEAPSCDQTIGSDQGRRGDARRRSFSEAAQPACRRRGRRSRREYRPLQPAIRNDALPRHTRPDRSSSLLHAHAG